VCEDNPCQFGSTCVPYPASGFLCLCPLGKHGIYCEHGKYSKQHNNIVSGFDLLLGQLHNNIVSGCDAILGQLHNNIVSGCDAVLGQFHDNIVSGCDAVLGQLHNNIVSGCDAILGQLHDNTLCVSRCDAILPTCL
jgi:hypothetical protein